MGIPFVGRSKAILRGYILNEEMIAKHSFLPLIRRDVIAYPFKINETGKRKRKCKTRELTFASHVDAAIFAYYAERLQGRYEEYLQNHNISAAVTAYRRIKCENRHGNKCNIDIANDIFKYIKENIRQNDPLAVVTFDIKGFFDNLNHKKLKSKWKKVIGVDELPMDMYAVFKNVTKYSYVKETELFDHFRNRIYCKSKTGCISCKKVRRRSYLRDKGAIAFCKKSDIPEIRNAHLIHTRKEEKEEDRIKGIPQGLPISSVLANLYMVDFDEAVNKTLKLVGGKYQRYSDDIVIVCPLCVGQYLRNWVIDKIKDECLEIEESKTNLYIFTSDGDGKVQCKHESKGENKKLEYLGFSFDGERILIKNASVSRFYHKMYSGVRRSVYHAIHIHNATKGTIFASTLIRRYTYAGAKKHKVYLRNADKTFSLSKKPSFKGNFLSYVKKSTAIIGDDAIGHQLRHCTNKLSKAMDKAKNDVVASILKRRQIQLKRYGRIYP